MDREHVLSMLREHEPELKEAGVVRLSQFGSTARGEAGPESDVDLLAAYHKSRRLSLLDLIGIEIRLAELLGVKVDLIEEGTLKPRVQRSVAPEVLRAF